MSFALEIFENCFLNTAVVGVLFEVNAMRHWLNVTNKWNGGIDCSSHVHTDVYLRRTRKLYVSITYTQLGVQNNEIKSFDFPLWELLFIRIERRKKPS